MGNSQSLSDKVYRHAKQGEYHELRELVDHLRRTSAEHARNLPALLDAPGDEDGSTPLIAAASRGHFQVAEFLLQCGASQLPQNRRSEGGSALHEAVAKQHAHIVDLLLRHRGNAFVENAKGFTAMDLACSTQNVDLLRRIETTASWSGWLVQKVPRLGGLSTEWQRRWVVISHRFPYPGAPQAHRLVHIVLCCFRATDSTTPVCRAWLDGARAEEHAAAAAGGGASRLPQLELRLHRKHAAPSGAHATGSAQAGFTLHFRADDATPAGCDAFRAFVRTVNGHPAPAGSAPGLQPGPRPPGSNPDYSPLGAGAGRVAPPGARPDDGALARRLQEEEDAALARRLQNAGSFGPSDRPAAAAAAGPSQPQRPLGSQPSQDVAALYPAVRYDHAPPTPHAGGQPAPSQNPGFSGSNLPESTRPSAPYSTNFSGPGPGAPVPSPAQVPTPAAAAAVLGTASISADADDSCVVCYDRAIEVTFLHGDTGHRACCGACADVIWRSSKLCPKCRSPIDRIIKVY